MKLSKGFLFAKKYYLLLLVPIILDLLQLKDILGSARRFNLQVTVPSALPSVTQVLNNQNQGGGNFNVDLPYDFLGNGILIALAIVFFVLAGAFLKGGFLGCILAGIEEQEVSVNTFMQTAKEYFGRFLAQVILMFALFIPVMTLVVVFWPLGPVLIIGIFILAFFLTFWDYSIVAENAGLIEAAKISLGHVKANFGKVVYFLLPIVVITALLSILANALVGAGPLLAVIAIAVYAFFATAVIFTLMEFYLVLSGREIGSDFVE